MSRSFKDYAIIFLKGMGMGGADVVPGVSGGTIAFITGIYEELLDSIKSFDISAFNLLRSFQWKKLWKHINGSFLLALITGIFFSLLTLVQLITFLLENYPIQLWSFFFGLVLISCFIVAKKIHKFSFKVICWTLVGLSIAYFITSSTPSEAPQDLWFIFIAGAIAVCAMILPGISGSFILLLMGLYQVIIHAVKDFQLSILFVFALGGLSGLLSFSRLISWFLKKFHDSTVALLVGFMFGSLSKLWPWKIAEKTFIDRHGDIRPLVERNISPSEYELNGLESNLTYAILCMLAGIFLVIIIEFFSIKLSKASNK